MTHDAQCEWQYRHQFCGCAERALAQAQEEREDLRGELTDIKVLLGITGPTNIGDVFEAVEGEIGKLKAARKHGPIPRSECDLCQGPVDPAGSDWEWVEDGWSLACKPCLERIRGPLRAQAAAAAMYDVLAFVWGQYPEMRGVLSALEEKFPELGKTLTEPGGQP